MFLSLQKSRSRESSNPYSSSKLTFLLCLARDDPYLISWAFLRPRIYSGSSNNNEVGPKSLKPAPHSTLFSCPLLPDFLCESMYFSIWSRLVNPLDLKNLICSMTSLSRRSLIKLLTIFWCSSSVLNLANIFMELMISRSSFDLFRSYF